MNKVILVGRLTRDPEVRYSAGDNAMAIARYSLAVDRRGRRDNSGGDQPTADFINIVAFGRDGEFRPWHRGADQLCPGGLQVSGNPICRQCEARQRDLLQSRRDRHKGGCL